MGARISNFAVKIKDGSDGLTSEKGDMMLNTRLLTLALTMAFVLLIPQTASTQGLGAREDNTSLQGTTLTYYPQPNFGQCQADCANNGNCKGFTWIQAGTYKAGDAAMCYLLSAVTGKSSARGHFSAVKGGGGDGGCGTDFSIQSPRSAAAGSRVKINFSYRERPSGQTHWIGLFAVGSNQYREWYWVKDLQGCEASFAAPASGEYEFRYFLDGGYDKVAARAYLTTR